MVDSAELQKMEEKARKGLPEASETDTYYKAWWNAYKGGDRGKLGGMVIGAGLGGAIGTGVAAIATFATGGMAPLAFGMIVAGFAAGGMAYEAHDFSLTGKIAGGMAGGLETTEAQLKEYTSVKFDEVNRKIDTLTQLVAGGKSATAGEAKPLLSPANQQVSESEALERIETMHRQKQHCDTQHCGKENRKLVFWKVALMGALIGVVAGALLAAGGLTTEIFHLFGAAGKALAPQSSLGLYAASIATCGLIGASFGINRDLYRQVFDVTDRWYKGLVFNGKSNEKAPARAQEAAPEHRTLVAETPATVTRDAQEAEPPYRKVKSDTHYRDRVMTEAKQALLSLDHTKAIRH